MSDYISRADAIEAVHEYFRARLAESDGEWNDELQEYVFSKEDKGLLEYNKGVNTALKALPSADAVSRKAKCCPIAETCMSIDCPVSSEYIGRPSADAVQGWIPLSHDDNGLGTDFPYERDGEWVIVTDGKNISVERIKKDAYDHFFPNGRWFELEEVVAWMPLPTPYKGGDDE